MSYIEKQVKAESQKWIRAFNNQDIDKMVEGYYPDAVAEVRLFSPNPTQIRGHQDIRQFWVDFMQQNPNNLTYRNVSVRTIDESHAILSADWSMNIASGFITEELWIRDGNKWRIKRDNFSVLTQHSRAARPALILVDFQNDYFNTGKMPLPNMVKAAINSRILLDYWRSQALPVIHIQHIFPDTEAPFFSKGSKGKDITPSLIPKQGETHLVKSEVNAFNGSGLGQVLMQEGITELIVTGAMAHLCVAAIVKQAADQGYPCKLITDACAAPTTDQIQVTEEALSFGYAELLTCQQLIESYNNHSEKTTLTS